MTKRIDELIAKARERALSLNDVLDALEERGVKATVVAIYGEHERFTPLRVDRVQLQLTDIKPREKVAPGTSV